MARALWDWLPRVIQAVKPWMSESDIGKGTRWEQEISVQLLNSQFGVFCLTPENLDSRWINFEAGAISKTLERTHVCTYLIDLKPTDIDGPLSQFNHTKAEKEDTRRLVQTIHQAFEGQSLSESIVDDAFDIFWPRLEKALKELPSADLPPEPPRKLEDMVEEILGLVRVQTRFDSRYNFDSKLPRPRHPITLDWTPEDAKLLTEYYGQCSYVLQESLDEFLIDEFHALALLGVLQRVKSAGFYNERSNDQSLWSIFGAARRKVKRDQADEHSNS